MTFALATVRLDGRPTPVVRVDGETYRLSDVLSETGGSFPERGLLSLFDDWESSERDLMGAVEALRASNSKPEEVGTLAADDYLAPLLYPNKVVCFGANYYDHMRGDVGMTDFHRDNLVPTMFIKSPTNTMVGNGRSVRFPSQTEQFDWEVELAAVIGKRAKRVKAADALTVVAAYTVAIDLSARDWQVHPKHPFKFDLFGGKTFDDSCPIGPWLVPARFIDQRNVQLRLSLNGNVKQDGNTKDMIWSIEEQIEAMTSHVTLDPGDVILTGTPSGVGLKTGEFLKVGDKLTAEVVDVSRLDIEIGPDQDMPFFDGLEVLAHA